MWSFAKVNNEQFGEVEVYQFSALYDPEAKEFLNLTVSFLSKATSLIKRRVKHAWLDGGNNTGDSHYNQN